MPERPLSDPPTDSLTTFEETERDAGCVNITPNPYRVNLHQSGWYPESGDQGAAQASMLVMALAHKQPSRSDNPGAGARSIM